MRSLPRDWLCILALSLLGGLALSLACPGKWWIGWLAFALLLALGLWALTALWRSAGGGRSLGWMLILSLGLRLGLGIFFSLALPVYGNVESEVHQAGYVYRDGSTYDAQAWDLAVSGEPLWKAFDRSSGIEEQYGGLTLVLSLTYRLLSPDAHRPWLGMLLSALAWALGVGLAWKAARQAWGEKAAQGVGWIMALYPESLLAGFSPIREPYLLLFIAMAFWGALLWQEHRRFPAVAWLGGGTVGLFLFSPGIVVTTALLLAVWAWLARRERRIHWAWGVGAAAVIGLAGWFLSQIVAGSLKIHLQGGPLETLINWLRLAAKFNVHETVHSSGWLQTVLRNVPKSMQVPLVTLFGIIQPVLPGAIVDPATGLVRSLSIFRSAGWYALLPLLVYSLRPALKTADRRQRLAWLWLWLAAWCWIVLASARAGGDQWDNPRYRLILLMPQAALAAYSLSWARQERDRWLNRLLVIEGVFLLLFTAWYAFRYLPVNLLAGESFLALKIAAGAFVLISAAILIGGWIMDRRRSRSGDQAGSSIPDSLQDSQ